MNSLSHCLLTSSFQSAFQDPPLHSHSSSFSSLSSWRASHQLPNWGNTHCTSLLEDNGLWQVPGPHRNTCHHSPAHLTAPSTVAALACGVQGGSKLSVLVFITWEMGRERFAHPSHVCSPPSNQRFLAQLPTTKQYDRLWKWSCAQLPLRQWLCRVDHNL